MGVACHTLVSHIILTRHASNITFCSTTPAAEGEGSLKPGAPAVTPPAVTMAPFCVANCPGVPKMGVPLPLLLKVMVREEPGAIASALDRKVTLALWHVWLTDATQVGRVKAVTW